MSERAKILLIDKPTGVTSFDVIRQLRRQTGIRKFGHSGTLDPAATGLMIVGYNEGTKKLAEYIKLDKEYEAVVRLGELRTTGDMDGEILEEVSISKKLLEDEITDVVASMVGKCELPVSAYSTIKVAGVPYYKKARQAAKKGELVTEIPYRDMTVYKAKYLGLQVVADKLHISVRFSVASGTYIRSLAEELGRRLGYPAVLFSLRRTKIGEFSIADAKPPEYYHNLI